MIFKSNPIFNFFISNLLLLSICVGFFLFSLAPKDGNLVYCPLQKTWVKRIEESQPIRQNPLDQICMSDKQKQELAIQISLKNAFAIDEKGVFETLQKGVKVLENYRETQSLPNQNLAQIRQSFSVLNSANDLRQNFVAKSEAFSFAQNSRPPTFVNSTKFDFQTTKNLETISRNINPRSPPFSI